ncbi:MICOS complex subunit MIC27 isoform X2 [Trichomycterus rosablanca]
MSENKSESLLSPHQLSIYPPQESRHYIEEQPGVLQRGLGRFRETLQSYVQNIRNGALSVKQTGVNLYHGAEDVYHFLKDPPPGFVPKVTLITVSGLAGVILARKGSRLKRVMLPVGLTSAGLGVCYPVQTITVLKVSGRKVYTASQWTSSTVASLWKSITAVPVPASPEPQSEPSAEPVIETSPAQADDPEIEQVPPPPETSPISTPEDQDSVPVSLSAPDNTSSSTVEEFLVVNTEGKPSSLSQTTQRESERASLPSSEELQTLTEEREHRANPQLKDFGQSNPEDADLYTTRS